MNGNKVNTNNLALEGAKFRIYSDEAMTKEVIVKKKESTNAQEQTAPTATADNANTGAISGTDSKSKSLNDYIVVDKDSAGNAQGVDIVSDANGNFSIVGLDSGVYYLKEVSAPDGYRTLKDPIKVTINAKLNDDKDH